MVSLCEELKKSQFVHYCVCDTYNITLTGFAIRAVVMKDIFYPDSTLLSKYVFLLRFTKKYVKYLKNEKKKRERKKDLF